MFSTRTNWDRTPNRLSDALARRRAAGLEILDLTESNPTRCGFAWDAEVLRKALGGQGIADYRPEPRGLEDARSAVRSYYTDQGLDIKDEQIVLTASTSEAYSFVLRLLTEPGDQLLSPAPSYPLIRYLADLHDLTLSHYPLLYDHGWTLDIAALESSITDRTRAVIAVSPNNPTGSYLGDADREQLSRLAADHGLALVVDEVFRDYAWTETAHLPSSTATVEQCLTFTLSGLSKVAALPQMKLGWIVVSGPTALRDEALGRLEVIADTYLSVGAPVQIAARSLIEKRAAIQERILGRIRENLILLDDVLSGSRCSRLQGDGGWYAVLRVPRTLGDEERAIGLVERAGVYLHPGRFFDFTAEGCLVVSLITPEETLRKGVERITEACGNT